MLTFLKNYQNGVASSKLITYHVKNSTLRVNITQFSKVDKKNRNGKYDLLVIELSAKFQLDHPTFIVVIELQYFFNSMLITPKAHVTKLNCLNKQINHVCKILKLETF